MEIDSYKIYMVRNQMGEPHGEKRPTQGTTGREGMSEKKAQ